MTSTSLPKKTLAQSASIPFAYPSFDDSRHLPFDSLHHDSQHPPFSGFSHHPDPHDGVSNPPSSSTQSQAEVNFGRVYRSQTPVGHHPTLSQSFFKTIFPNLRVSTSVSPILWRNMQPKFYVGSAMHHTLDRECSRSRKYLQLTNERLFQAELALRYWQDHDNLYIWAPIPIYTDRTDYRSLEMALIQEWQPRLNYPFICQFFHPKKGILKKPLLNTNAQFGSGHSLALSQTQNHSKTRPPNLDLITVSNRLELWTIIHALGSNTKARFEQTKMLRSNDGGLALCYALRRLANNIQEPFRTLSLNAIDASIKWWHGKPAPRASALRAPWSLTPNLQQQLRKFLRQWHFQMLEHQVPCHTPSFKMVFIKHAAVLDQLCNHKKAIDDWSTSNPAICCCQHWSSYKSAALNPSDSHWVLSGSLLHSLLPPELAVIAEGSLSNKVFPSKKEYQKIKNATWYEKLDQEKWLTVHATLEHL